MYAKEPGLATSICNDTSSAARVLCHQLRRKRALPEKKRIVHLICLYLLAVLNRPSQQA